MLKREQLANYASNLIIAGNRMTGIIQMVLLSLKTDVPLSEFADELRESSKEWEKAKSLESPMGNKPRSCLNCNFCDWSIVNRLGLIDPVNTALLVCTNGFVKGTIPRWCSDMWYSGRCQQGQLWQKKKEPK